MEKIYILYSLCAGFGLTFLVIQFFCSFDDDVDTGSAGTDDAGHGHNFDTASSHDHLSEIHSDDVANQLGNSSLASSSFLMFMTFLRIIRKFVYFCAGFGLMGMVCFFLKVNIPVGLVASLIVGTVTVFLSNLLFQLIKPQAHRKDSKIENKELVGCFGEVLSKVGTDTSALGEIKIALEKQIVNIYAYAKDGKSCFSKGDIVTVYNFDKKGFAMVEKANDKDIMNSDIVNDIAEKE